jgi:hypothetical protein
MREVRDAIRIHLITCIGVDHGIDLIPHFLRHYLDLGIRPEEFRVVLHSREPRSSDLSRATAWLSEVGIEPSEVWVAPYTSTAMWEKRRDVQAQIVSEDDWVVSADVDEFHEYPEELRTLLRGCQARGIDALQGPFIDRVATNGELARIEPAVPLWDQFPLETDATWAIGRAGRYHGKQGTVKLMAFRGYLRPARGGHYLLSGDRRPRYYFGINLGHLPNIHRPEVRFFLPLRVHHFKWTAGMTESVRTRLETPGASPAGSEYGRKLLDHFGDRGCLRVHAVASPPPGGTIAAKLHSFAWPAYLWVGRVLGVPRMIARRLIGRFA